MSVPTLIPTATVKNISYSAAVAATAFTANEAPGKTCTLRLCATTDCYYLISVAGTVATTSNATLLPAGAIEYVRVADQSIVSAIQSTASGILNITQMADVSTPQ